jgi:hypothetical protein
VDDAAAIFILRPVLARDGCPPQAAQFMAEHGPGLRPATGQTGAGGQPEIAFGTDHPRPALLDPLMKAGRMKGPPRLINKAGNAIFFGFGDMFAAQFLQPARCFGCLFKVEAAGIQYLFQLYLAKAGMQDVCPRVQRAQDGFQPCDIGG